MAVPLIWVAVMGARVAAPTIIRFIASKGAQKAAQKYGLNVVKQMTKLAKSYKGKNSSMVNAIKNLNKGTTKLLTKTVVKGGKKFKVRYVAKTAKGKAILKKVLKTAKPKPTKVVKGRPVKTAKPKPTKIAKPKPTKVAKPKPTKVAKPTAKLKTKPFWTKGKIIGAAVGGGTIAGMLLTKKKPDKKVIKPEIIKKPEKKPYPKDDDYDKDSSPYVRPDVKTMPTGPQVKKKFTEEREKSFEARVRALVAQKDRLKNIPAGDGVRSEYQVRMHKLKKENKKAWKKLFTIVGKLK